MMCRCRMPSFPFRLFCVCLLAVFVAGCAQEPANDVVAEVNGVPLYFYEMNAQRDIFFQGLSQDGTPPDDETLRQQYGYALTTIIEQELIRQYLKKKNIQVDENAVVKDEALVQGDYMSTAQFRDFLIANGISLELWHQMMQRRQDVITFTNEVLRPEFVITPDEIEKYYAEHKDEFQFPEQWDFVYFEGSDKDKVAEARRVFIASRDAVQARNAADVLVRDVRMNKDRLPEIILKELATLQPYMPGPITRVEDVYHTCVLREIVPAGVLDVGQTYNRIEQILVEEKTQILLQQWLEKEFSKAVIKVNSPLLKPVDIHPEGKNDVHDMLFGGHDQGTESQDDDTYSVDFFLPEGNTEVQDDYEPLEQPEQAQEKKGIPAP